MSEKIAQSRIHSWGCAHFYAGGRIKLMFKNLFNQNTSLKNIPIADIKDINLLNELKSALEAIKPESFTRYQKLLELLRDKTVST